MFQAAQANYVVFLEKEVYLPKSPQVGNSYRANCREMEEVGRLLSNDLKDTASQARPKMDAIMYWSALNGDESLMKVCLDECGGDAKAVTKS